MEKGLLFLTLSTLFLWLLLDEFFGKKRISLLADKITPQINSVTDQIANNFEGAKEDYLKDEDTLGGKFMDRYEPKEA